MSLKDIFNALVGLKTESVVVIDTKALLADTDYAAEDVMSESDSAGDAYAFSGMAKKSGGTGAIEKAIAYCDTTNITPRVTLYLYSQKPTSNLNDNAANAGPNIADHPFFQGQLDFTALEDLGGGSSATITLSTSGNLPLQYKCEPGSTTIWGIAVTRDAITGEVTRMILSFTFQVRQD